MAYHHLTKLERYTCVMFRQEGLVLSKDDLEIILERYLKSVLLLSSFFRSLLQADTLLAFLPFKDGGEPNPHPEADHIQIATHTPPSSSDEFSDNEQCNELPINCDGAKCECQLIVLQRRQREGKQADDIRGKVEWGRRGGGHCGRHVLL